MNNSRPIKVIVFEDQPDLRDSLISLLEDCEDIECCGAWENCSDAEHIVEVYQPAIVLMDIDMPVMNGIEGTKILSNKFPGLPVIMLTVFDDDENIFNAICAGASGYILKKSAPEKIIQSIREALSGGAPITAAVAKRMLQFFPKKAVEEDTDLNNLTQREKQILGFLAEGQSYKLIANGLGISIDTVRSHIKKIYEKLHVNSATAAVSRFLHSR